MAEPFGSAPARVAELRLGDDELIESVRSAVEGVLATTAQRFESTAVFRGGLPVERIDAHGEVDVLVEAVDGGRLHVDREALLEFRGPFDGRLALRCAANGALELAQGLLMLERTTNLAVEELDDALKECVSRICSALKRTALDPLGKFELSVPFMKDGPREPVGQECGALVYTLSTGALSVEVWRRDKPVTPAQRQEPR